MEHLYKFSSFTYFIAAIFLPRSNREGDLIRDFIFRIDYLDYWQKQLPHRSKWINLCVQFCFFKGIQTKYNRLVALSLAVIVIYMAVWYVLSPESTGEKSISWEGHLGGLITGFCSLDL
jgi:membrane associated rhomboid family serine protease